MIQIEVIGNLGGDAEYKEFNGQKHIAFNVASTERYKDVNGTQHSRTTWVSCLKAGESNVISYLKRGSKVFIRGDFSARTFSSAQGVQVGVNCRVHELQLLDTKKDDHPTSPAGQPQVTEASKEPCPF